jgi:putative intracellular protease/amidase
MNHFQKPLMKSILLVALLGSARTRGCAQPRQQYNIAIFLYQGVELLDFAGPGEAFSATPGFNVYTVSVDGKQLVSQGFVSITPQYSLENAPTPDIAVFPGGSVGESSKDQKILDWINSLAAKGTTVMSICNGAVIVAKTGLLNGLTVTTHHEAIAGLRKLLPQSTVLDDAKYVDNGNIITTAGVSSGIEGALHVISRIKGKDVARSVAVYMEYNKWTPEEGLTLYKNEWLEKWKGGSKSPGANAQVPYEGELKNLAMEFLEEKKVDDAAMIMEQGVKWYPHSASSFNILGVAYSRLGKPAPISEERFIGLIDSGKCDETLLVYERTQKDFPGWALFEESSVNSAGYRLLRKDNYANALKTFSLNIKAFPQSWNAWDGMAEACRKAGNKTEAIKDYRRSLELNPKNDNARNSLAQLGAN